MPYKNRSHIWLFLSYVLIAGLAAGAMWVFCTHQSETASGVTDKKKFTVALMYANLDFYHKRSVDGFLAALRSDEQLARTCDVRTYEVQALDTLFLRQVAESLCADSPDLIVPFGGDITRAVAAVTRTRGLNIPVVFVGISIPVELGLVQSTERSGNNFTGFGTGTNSSTDPFELLHIVLPHVKKVLVPYDASSMGQVSEKAAENAKRTLARFNIDTELLPISGNVDVVQVVRSRIDDCDLVTYMEADRIHRSHAALLKLCKQHAKVLYPLELRNMPEGTAIGYGIDPEAVGAAAIEYVRKILIDKKAPTDLPSRRIDDTRHMLINLDEAVAQGIQLDEAVLKVLHKVAFYRKENV